jgi:hypothetical protein
LFQVEIPPVAAQLGFDERLAGPAFLEDTDTGAAVSEDAAARTGQGRILRAARIGGSAGAAHRHDADEALLGVAEVYAAGLREGDGGEEQEAGGQARISE